MQPKRRQRGDHPPTPVRSPIQIAVDGIVTPLSRSKARRVVESVLRAERVPRALISVAFVTNRRISALNREHLAHVGATDVISFGFSRAKRADPIVGDIYIAPDVARKNARASGVSAREEIVRLLVHGTLHVLGYDHPIGGGREKSVMWKRQERLVARSMKAAGLQ
jgi:probable rRNA maturation factor